jgi:hypothetical protein
MKLLYASAFTLASLILMSCHKDKRELLGPEALLIRPIHNMAVLPDATLNQMKLYYFSSQTIKEYVGDFGRASGSGYQWGILSTTDVASLSANDNIKYYYLEFPDGDIDTLFVNYQQISDDEARDNDCFCNKPQLGLKLNGNVPSQDTLKPGGIPVYRLYK